MHQNNTRRSTENVSSWMRTKNLFHFVAEACIVAKHQASEIVRTDSFFPAWKPCQPVAVWCAVSLTY